MYAQIFATADGWCRAYPMEKKSHAHEGLSLLFQREGVPNTMNMNNAREQIMGTFRKKCRERPEFMSNKLNLTHHGQMQPKLQSES